MIPTQIFLDLDDVLNKFTMQALTKVGCKVNPLDPFSSFDPAWKFDIIKAVNGLHPRRKQFTHESFWRLFERSFWANLPLSEEFDLLLTKSEALVGRKNVCILTCPVSNPDCTAGKVEWIYANLPVWLHRQFLIGPQKYLLARPQALLIDDSDENVDVFRRHNGQAFLLPRPWNSRHGNNAKQDLIGLFGCFQALQYYLT